MTARDISRISAAVLVAVACTWWAATSDYSPLAPQADRPVLRVIRQLARLGLWVMVFADPPPADQSYVVHARVDEHGHRVLNHGQGW
jgi:hypothetical protein